MNEKTGGIDLKSSLDEGAFPEGIVKKLEILKAKLNGKMCIVAFSGGVDSTVLLIIAKSFCAEVYAVHVDMPLNSTGETEAARELAKLLDVELHVLNRRPLDNDDFASNDARRCYHCKMYNFKALKELQEELKFEMILEGSNVDDAGDYRPGMDALKELGIESAFQPVGITKQEIREIARVLGLPNAGKPSNACLASRIAYGIKINDDLLDKIDKAEILIKESLEVKNLRARVHQGDILRIELEKTDLPKIMTEKSTQIIELSKKLKGLGFKKVALDLDGYETGSMNYAIEKD
ncbi:MAG: ATP-dependent sacrificial sulfur transferase LarE [Candidatus Hodarchaeota archaeon]